MSVMISLDCQHKYAHTFCGLSVLSALANPIGAFGRQPPSSHRTENPSEPPGFIFHTASKNRKLF